MSENKKFYILLSSNNFLLASCTIIFLLSIFIRSFLGIGSDTGVYLDFGQKILDGKKYYYDFFEGNFPLSFYFYALQIWIAKLIHISPILMSEIVVNFLGVSSIYGAAKFLQKTTIYDDKAVYNLIIIALYLAFFLRSSSLIYAEFGTKTTFLFALLFPYIASSFERRTNFSKSELIYRGFCMGLMPCLKPHYLFLLIFIEFYNFYQKKSFKFFLELDKLIMALIGSLYFFLMIKFIPQFFEFIIPMQTSFYYDEFDGFFTNIGRNISWRFIICFLMLIIFSRLKFTKNDLVLTIFLFSSFILLATENIATFDQLAVFFGIAVICYSKWLYDLLTKYWSIFYEKIYIALLIAIFCFLISNEIFLAGFIAFFYWLILPPYFIYLFFQNKKSANNLNKKIAIISIIYLFLAIPTFLVLKYFGQDNFYSLSLISLLFIIFFFEKNYLNSSKNFSSFTVFLVITAIFFIYGRYFISIFAAFYNDGLTRKLNVLTNKIASYSQIYAPQKSDKILLLFGQNIHIFPLLNHLEKENFYIGSSVPNLLYFSDKKGFLYSKNYEKSVILNYLFLDLKERIKNKNLKLLFVNSIIYIDDKSCLIPALEYYFNDLEFRKIFFENFNFENRILISDDNPKFNFLANEKDKKIKQPKYPILYDFEVYVRKEAKN